MQTLYLIHVGCACLSITGFAVRGMWMLTGDGRLQSRLTKTLPHIVDTLLLASAIAILVQWRMSPLQQPWLLAKIAALLLYIGLGMLALRFGRGRRVRAGAYVLALATAAYIVSVALSKNPWGFFALAGI